MNSEVFKVIIDFHTHCFPDEIAEKAIGKLAGIGNIEHFTNGTLAENRAYLDKCGVDRAVICNIATNPRQNTNVNNFAIKVKRERGNFYPLGSLHPDCDRAFIKTECARLASEGIRGIKLHPDYMGKYFDDAAFDPIFEACVDNDMFVITHAGWDFFSPDDIHCTPEMILRVMRKYPELKLVAAHMGSNRLGDDVERYLVGQNLWFDTSLLALGGWDRDQARRILVSHSPDRLLFASDLPWTSPKAGLDYLDSLGLDEALLDKIKSKNALSLLGE